jgi:arsenate reductase-like glutaredoxin family protein
MPVATSQPLPAFRANPQPLYTCAVRCLVRKDPYLAQLGLDDADYVTPEAVADLLVEHPRLMQRPVLIKGERAIIGRPKDRVRPFLES